MKDMWSDGDRKDVEEKIYNISQSRAIDIAPFVAKYQL